MNINRDYLIINDVKKSNIKLDNGSMFFYITDKNTQNIFVNLVINVSNNDLIQKFANIENAEDYTLTMNIVKPSNTYKVVEGKLHDKEKAIFEFDLNEDCCNEIGTYRCELLTKCNINNHEEITTSNKLTYKVKSSVLNDLDDIVEAPEYPLVIQLFDKLSDIEQYEEDRRANELARQLAEEQRQTRFNTLDADMTDSIQAMDNKVTEVENRITTKEQAVDKLIVDTKADINEYKVAKDQEIDEYKALKDTEINNAIANQDNKIDTAISNQNDRIAVVENNDVVQDNRLDILENRDTTHEARMVAIEAKNTEQDTRLDTIEAIDVAQNTRLDAIEAKNTEQDNRLLDIEKVNKRQDMNLKCLFAESKNNMIDITEEGNSIYLQNSTTGYTLIDEIKGNTLVNCNKEPNKELILNGNINTSGDDTVTITEGVDGGLVDVALEGNTLVNVSKTKDSTPITKAYTVENSGNHIALQGDVDGSCRPVITGNTLVNLANGKLFTYSDKLVITEDSITYDLPSGNGQPGIYANLSYSLKPSTEYTIIVNVLEYTTGVLHFRFRTDNSASSSETIINSAGLNKIKLTTDSESSCTNLMIFNRGGIDNQYTISRDIIILEGNYSDKPIPDYFTGLQSTFEDNLVTQEMIDNGDELSENLGKYKVECKVTGKNKLNPTNSKVEGYLSDIGGTTQGRFTQYAGADSVSYIYPCLPNTTYTVSHTGNTNAIAEFDKYPISGDAGNIVYNRTLTTSSTTKWLVIYANSTWTDDDLHAQLEYGDTATSYEPYKEGNKTLYLNSPLLEGDTIEEKDGGIYHVHRNELVVVDGSDDENWSLNRNIENTYFSYIRNSKADAVKNALTSISDKLPTASIDKLITSINHNTGTGKIQIGCTISSLSEFKQWLQQNPLTIVYELASPTYELIEQSNLIIPSYANGHLDFDTAVPVEKVDFLPFSEELTYLYANTQYTVQFISYAAITTDITLGGTQLLAQSIVKGLNRISITTPSELVDNKLTINGNDTGANIMEVIVTDIDRELMYFEGMKSVGECEELQVISINSDKHLVNTQQLTHEPLRGTRDAKDRYVLIDGKWYIERKCGVRAYQEGDEDNYKTDLVNTVYPLEMPIYEEIDYNPLEVYSGTTNITTNSTIPTNITVKNHGFNCLLKPNTTYTISSNLGLNTVTTPSTLTEDCLRFMDTDTSDVTTMKNVLVLEGDWTGKADLIPAKFSGIESSFEQELVTDENDVNFGKYKVTAKVIGKNLFDGKVSDDTKSRIDERRGILFYKDNSLIDSARVTDYIKVEPNTTIIHTEHNVNSVQSFAFYDFEKKYIAGGYKYRAEQVPLGACYFRVTFDKTLPFQVEQGDTSTAYEPYKESNITFYIDEPLRGIGDIKDRVYVKDDKVVVERNCGIRPYEDGDFGTYLTDKINTVYPLAEPIYEEVEYNDTKLFIESFKNSTLFYNSNVPVTSKLYYSYSVPIVDTVAQTANVTDQQDSMIIDLATQVAVMEMMLM